MNEKPIIIKKAAEADASSSSSSRIEKALEAEKEAQEKAAEADAAARIAELEAKLAASQKAEEANKKRMEELEAKIAKDKEAKKKRQEEARADKAELAALKKALNSKLGEIDILARAMIEISSEKPKGWTRKELLKLYLEKLGMDEAHEKAPLKEATLNAQTGARIQPRLEKLGYKLSRAASDMGKALYICIPLKG
jgi:chromosome segregation ATPase